MCLHTDTVDPYKDDFYNQDLLLYLWNSYYLSFENIRIYLFRRKTIKRFKTHSTVHETCWRCNLGPCRCSCQFYIVVVLLNQPTLCFCKSFYPKHCQSGIRNSLTHGTQVLFFVLFVARSQVTFIYWMDILTRTVSSIWFN